MRGAAGAADYVDRIARRVHDRSADDLGRRPVLRSPRRRRAGFDEYLPLSRLEELAWRTRIEGSRGLPEREWNGPVRGWQEVYRDGIAALGSDFLDRRRDRSGRVLDAQPELKQLLFEHACEASLRRARVRRQP